jgi:ferric-dicitrate binding protein FerR (iron transport regulator)
MKKQIPWELLISHLKQENSADEEAVLTQWRGAGENEAFYRDIVSLWEEIRSESAAYKPDKEYAWKQLETRINRLEKGRKRYLSLSLRQIRVAIAAASVLLVVAVAASYRFGRLHFQPETGVQTCKAVNGKTQVVLPDGSLVWLNLGSALTYETPFLRHREVKLDGEALFEVRGDGEHPFTVQADDVRVKVLGTRFNVQAYPQHTDIRVALLKGKVCLSAGEQVWEMHPGEIASFNRETHLFSGRKDDVSFESCWASNKCSFEAKPLRYICKYLERWYNVDIRVDPAIAESQVYTFSITDEPLETVLQIMSRINPVRYSFDEDRTVTIKQHVQPSKKRMPME